MIRSRDQIEMDMAVKMFGDIERLRAEIIKKVPWCPSAEECVRVFLDFYFHKYPEDASERHLIEPALVQRVLELQKEAS